MLAPTPGVPELDGRAQHVGQRVDRNELHQLVGSQLGVPLLVALGLRLGLERDQLAGVLGELHQRAHLRAAALDALLLEQPVLDLLERVEHVEDARALEAQRGRALADRPDIDQAVQRILFLLDAELVARRARDHALAAAEPAAVVANDRLDGRQQLGGCHQADADARVAEDRLDDLAVAVVRNDDAVFDRVAADDAVRRHAHGEHRIRRRRQLVHHLLGGRAAVPGAGIAFLEDDHAARLDAWVSGVDRGGHEVGVAHVGDEAAALVDLQERLLGRPSTPRCAPCR